MKRTLFSLWALFALQPLRAQVQPLKVGDTLPTITSSTTLNYAGVELNTDRLRGKAILIDFWGPSCISCLQSFPKIEQLQNEFRDSLIIILVNKQSYDSTKRFFALRKKLKIPQVILLTGDTLLYQLFPHRGEPYHIWIDQWGIVRHMADAYNATAQNIREFLGQKNLQFASYVPKQKYIESLFDERWAKKVDYYSYIYRAINGVRTGAGLDTNFSHMNMVNASVVELYQAAYEEEGKHNFSRPGCLLLNVSDSLKRCLQKDPEDFGTWFNHFAYNYDLQLPLKKDNEKYQIMQADLQRYFGLSASIKKQERRCLVLKRTSEYDKLKTKAKLTKDNFFVDDIRSPINDPVRYFYRQPYKSFSSRLAGWVEYFLQIPVVDKTGFDEMIDIALDGKVLDNMTLPDLRKELGKYDLDLVEGRSQLNILVIEEK